MRFRDTVRFVTLTTTTDSMGRPQSSETLGVEIPCIEEAVGVTENYAAMAVGVMPSVKIRVRTSSYSGQTVMQYDGQRYRIIRAQRAEKGFTVLVGEAVGRA